MDLSQVKSFRDRVSELPSSRSQLASAVEDILNDLDEILENNDREDALITFGQQVSSEGSSSPVRSRSPSRSRSRGISPSPSWRIISSRISESPPRRSPSPSPSRHTIRTRSPSPSPSRHTIRTRSPSPSPSRHTIRTRSPSSSIVRYSPRKNRNIRFGPANKPTPAKYDINKSLDELIDEQKKTSRNRSRTFRDRRKFRNRNNQRSQNPVNIDDVLRKLIRENNLQLKRSINKSLDQLIREDVKPVNKRR